MIDKNMMMVVDMMMIFFMMTRLDVLMNVDEREYLPSLRGSVDVFVTLKYILMYIIILWCSNPIKDVFCCFMDVIIVY